MKKNKDIELEYRLYNSLHSSFFDLIKGNSEVQQTKGLALILSSDPKVLWEFFNIPSLKNKVDFNYDKAIINSELLSDDGENKRADIIIRLYKDGKPVQVFMIEAKSINKTHSVSQISDQLKSYLDEHFGKLTKSFDKNYYGVVLTKYPVILPADSDFIGITWSEIISFLEKSKKINKLTEDFYYYLTKIKGSMKYYEEEVLSIPTAKETNELANEYPFIYECPNKGRYIVKSKPLYITFRKSGGGDMEKLFGIDEIIILNPNNDLDTFMEDDNYSNEIRDRVKYYCEKIGVEKLNEEKQFFILSQENSILLPHKPKPKNRNNSYRAYYTLSYLLKGIEKGSFTDLKPSTS